MNNSINLVSKRRKPSKFHKRYFVVSMVFFSITFLVSASLIGYKLYLGSELSTLKEEETSLIQSVNSNTEKKVKYLTLRERLSEIQNIISRRKNINVKIESITDTVPRDVGVNSIRGDENEVTITVAAADLSSLNDLIEQRIQEYATDQNRGIQRVELRNFRLNTQSLQYEANLLIVFS